MKLLDDWCMDGPGGSEITNSDVVCAEGTENEFRLYLDLIEEL